jgi:hypothetical protein
MFAISKQFEVWLIFYRESYAGAPSVETSQQNGVGGVRW